MIEALKDDKIVRDCGGRFRLTSLVQARVRELLDGARPLVERRGRSDIEIAILEIAEGKIELDLSSDNVDPQEEPAEV